MQYGMTLHGTFLERPNRFIAYVQLHTADGTPKEPKTEVVHVKNTGRCRELLIPGAEVILEQSDNQARKTRYDLIMVYKKGTGWINMDSQAPNKVAKEWLLKQKAEAIKPEYTYGRSRLDFYFEFQGEKALMEVKGVTLERENKAYFPDAPTLRGVKHLQELTRAVKEGYRCFIAFVIQMEHMDKVYPNVETHPEFGKALAEAEAAGVIVLYLSCRVGEDTLAVSSANKQLSQVFAD